jgi:hypothetical protein
MWCQIAINHEGENEINNKLEYTFNIKREKLLIRICTTPDPDLGIRGINPALAVRLGQIGGGGGGGYIMNK